METKFKWAARLTVIVVFLSIIATVGGLVWDELYRDSELIKAVWFANDLITLFLALPLLLLAMHYALRGSLKAQLLWAGSLWYLIYNYVFYLYGAAFNSFFLLYILLFTLPVYTLVIVFSNMDIALIKSSFNVRTPTRAISIFLFFFAIALGAPWVAMVLGFIFTEQIPPFEMTIVFATDLSFLVSVLIFSAILLWKKNPWGYILGAMIMFKGLLYPLVLMIGGTLAYYRTGTWDTFIPLYFVLWVLCIYFYRLILTNVNR